MSESVNSQGLNQTDRLRDRIAAAIRRVDESYLNRPEPFMAEPASYEELADAVIAELKLHPVESLDRRFIRWATSWRNNPELGEHE